MIREKDFLEQIRELAKIFGWEYYHTWQSIHSPRGFPDIVLVRPPRIIFAELKSSSGKLSPAQKRWLDQLMQCPGVEAYLWRPEDLDDIVQCLR